MTAGFRRRSTGAGMASSGFTLIELLMVLAIIGLIAAIAIPSYRSYIQRSNRTDATSALLKVAAAQEKHFLQNNVYTDNEASAPPAGLGLATSDNGWYTITVVAPTVACPLASCWEATATPVTTGDNARQAGDADCWEFRINQLGVRTAKKKSGTDNTANCWRR